MAQRVWVVCCKSDGSLIAVYATRELAEARQSRAYRPDSLYVESWPVQERD